MNQHRLAARNFAQVMGGSPHPSRHRHRHSRTDWLIGMLLATSCVTFPGRGAGADQMPVTPERTLEEIEACVRENSPRVSLTQEATITTLDNTGADRTQEAKFYWKRGDDKLSRIFMLVESPRDLRGAAFLMIERSDRADDMWMYLPEIRKVRRISSRTISGSLFGTDFSYEDIQYLQPGFKGDLGKRLPDGEVAGRGVHVLQTEPAPELGSGYSRVVTYLDGEYCVPLKMEFYEDSDVLRKVLTVDPTKVTREANTWIARDIVLRDLDRETQSHFVAEKIKIDVDIPDRRFTQAQLAKGR
jgi:outer membrane lipoprotein-sorting protein